MIPSNEYAFVMAKFAKFDLKVMVWEIPGGAAVVCEHLGTRWQDMIHSGSFIDFTTAKPDKTWDIGTAFHLLCCEACAPGFEAIAEAAYLASAPRPS
jgi:hypothetical protein